MTHHIDSYFVGHEIVEWTKYQKNEGDTDGTECGSDLCLPRGGAEDEHVLADGLRVEVVQGYVRGLV